MQQVIRIIWACLLVGLLTACGGGGGGNTTPPVVDPTAWQPESGATPATGNYVYFKSEVGEFVGQGLERLFTDANALVSIGATPNTVQIQVKGEQIEWRGQFATPVSNTQIRPGVYVNLAGYPSNDGNVGGLSWSGEGRGCSTLRGWFVVESASYIRSTLMSIELRFEQQCEGVGPILRGKLRWAASNVVSVWGPLDAKYQLWQPPPGTTPGSGNYVFLQSELGDFVGAGGRYLYTQTNALLSTVAQGGHLSLGVRGDEQWTGEFQLPTPQNALQPGLYEGLKNYPFNTAADGGIAWHGEGRGCDGTGWVVIDSASYSGDQLTAFEMRFERRCGGGAFALRGKIRWSQADTTGPAGPVNPPPVGLWQPAPGTTPANGDFVFLQSDPDDFVGQGLTLIYTPANAMFTAQANGSLFSVTVDSDKYWGGDFQTMDLLTRFEPGYYGDLHKFPIHNPAKGGFDWHGNSRDCNRIYGWFVVDAVRYEGDTLASIELRFEQHCEGVTPALRGQIRWAR